MPSPRLISPAHAAFTGSSRVSGQPAPAPLRPIFRWAKVEGATHYWLTVDNRCEGELPNCAFSDQPEVDEAELTDTYYALPKDLPVTIRFPATPTAGGRVYYWTVRACDSDGCGPAAPTRVLRVGMLADDFDGDGYSDLMVGAPGRDTDGQRVAGTAYWYRGSPDGLESSAAATIANPDEPVGDSDTRFGEGIAAAGDTNGDGFGDVLVTRRGAVWLMLGGKDGPTLGAAPLEHGGDGVRLQVAAVGDVNHDGYDDVAIATPDASFEDDLEAGRITIHHGGPDGLSLAPDRILVPPDPQPTSWFGTALGSPGDINGDGFDDLVVGSPLYDDGPTDNGIYYAYYGGPEGIEAEVHVALHNPQPAANSYFGFTLAPRVDVDGDGYADVLVGQAFLREGGELHGAVYLFRGGSDGVSQTASSLVPDSPQNGSHYGESVAFGGDMDGDDVAELWVGEPYYSDAAEEQGRAHVYEPAAFGGDPTPAASIAGSPALENKTRFAQVIVNRADFNGDGFSDLALSGRLVNDVVNDAGVAYVYYGGEGKLGATAFPEPDLTLHRPEMSPVWFGTALSVY